MVGTKVKEKLIKMSYKVKNGYFYLNQLLEKIPEKLNTTFSLFGPLSLPLTWFTSCFLLYLFFRLLLTLLYFKRIIPVPSFYLTYFIGMRIDAIITCYLLGVPTLLFLLLPKSGVKFLRFFISSWGALFLCFAIAMEFFTPPFVAEYDLRPDRIFFEYLKYPKEVFGTIFKVHPFIFVFTLIAACTGFKIFYKTGLRSVENYNPWTWWQRLLAFPLIGALLFLGARSSLGHRPANISTAMFSKSNLVNELTLNSSYSLLYAIYRTKHETTPTKIYGKMSFEDAIAGVKKTLFIPQEDYIENGIPFYHQQISPFKRKKPLNVVIFLQESMGAEYVGALGGMPLTPELDKLSKEGLWFTNLYSTGTRTVRGIEATAAGFLPTPGSSVVKLGLARRNFLTAGSLFKKYGYNTMFIYGGESNFDEMRSFFMGNGFNEIYDEPTFVNPIMKGTWGVSDEDLVNKANEVFKTQNKPFFALMLSTTNHSPFEFPKGRIKNFTEPPATMFNALKFADYSIGKFFEMAKKEEYFKNTIFIVLADHNTRVYGDEFIPVHKFHIPGVIIGPDVPKMNYERISSQVDLLPTILHFTGLSTKHPMIGHNLMTLPKNFPGRALMQYGENNGYMRGDQLIVNRPYKVPLQFVYDSKTQKLTPALKLDEDLKMQAFSHIMMPWQIYERQLYKLKD